MTDRDREDDTAESPVLRTADDADEPGASSGREDLPHERVVPGTVSAGEGYPHAGGTSDNDPTAGVSASAEDLDVHEADDPELPDASDVRRSRRDES